MWYFLAFVLLIIFIFYRLSTRKTRRRKRILAQDFLQEWEKILVEKVHFYNDLSETDKKLFQAKIKIFLAEVTISGVELELDTETRLLVAASAIIPIFSFPEWEYYNLSEVLVYPDSIKKFKSNQGKQENFILGQVRPFQNQHILLLSKPALEQGFRNLKDKKNVGFHEFAHLIDELDGSIDGIPEALLPANLIKPWTDLIYKEIAKIKQRKSDIDPYGTTNQAEFFAVVTEYFFENPQAFAQKHPELYKILIQAFKPHFWKDFKKNIYK